MTLPMFLVPAGKLAGLAAGAGFTLDGDEGRHAAMVRRIRAGERIDVGDGAGVLAHCTVLTAGRDQLDLRVDGMVEVPARDTVLSLVQALAKGGRDEQAVETATEVGVDRVLPWRAARSVVRWEGERGEKARRRWESVAREAAKQSRRPWVPVVEPARSTAELALRVEQADLPLILHESAEQSIRGVELPSLHLAPGPQLPPEIMVIVGPEGGITEDEVVWLTQHGAIAVKLGPEVLRASTAGPIALAWLASRTDRWGEAKPYFPPYRRNRLP